MLCCDLKKAKINLHIFSCKLRSPDANAKENGYEPFLCDCPSLERDIATPYIASVIF